MIKRVVLGLSFPILLFSEGLNDLIKMSLENKDVISSQKIIESIQKEYKGVKKGYLPSVNIGAGYTDVSHETVANANNSLNAYVDVSYSIYDGGKKDLTYKTYESRIKGSKEDLNSLKNKVSLDVIVHYYSYLTYKAQKEAKFKEIEQLNAQYIRLNKFLNVGTTTIDEIDRIVSNLERVNVELHELDLQIETILHELEYIAGQKVSINAGSFIKIDYSQRELRNDIKSLEYRLNTQLLNAKNVKTQDNPQISLNNRYSYYENNYNNSNYEKNALDNQNVFGINLSWNIFDFGSTKKAYDAAHKTFLSTKSKYEYEKNKADVDLRLAKKSYKIAKLKINSAKAGLHAAISAYDVTKNKYENGLVDNVSYLEALSDKSDAESLLSSAKYDLEVKKANLIYQKGKNLWEFIK